MTFDELRLASILKTTREGVSSSVTRPAVNWTNQTSGPGRNRGRPDYFEIIFS
jgi:hypothetical protein